MALLGPFLSSRFTGLVPAGSAALLTSTAFAVTLVLLARLASLTTLLLTALTLLIALVLLAALMLLAPALALTLLITLVITLLHIVRLSIIGRHEDTPAVIGLQAHTRTAGVQQMSATFRHRRYPPDIDYVGLR
jgi:hypothetical protein